MRLEFRVRSDGVFKVGFSLTVDHDAQVGMMIGHKGRNLKYLRERIEIELANKYQKQAHVVILVKKRRDKHEVTSEQGYEIVPPDYGLKRTQEKLEMLKKGEISVLDVEK